MRVTIRYETADDGQEVSRPISPRAMVAWELFTKSKVSNLGQGIAVQDLVTMLWEQMRVDGDAPATKAELLNSLTNIDIDVQAPNQPDAEASPEPSPS